MEYPVQNTKSKKKNWKQESVIEDLDELKMFSSFS